MKNANQVLAHPNTKVLNAGLLKLEFCGPLSDITSADNLPNFRLEVCNNKTHELGTLFIRVFDSTYDSNKHDYASVLEKVKESLRVEITLLDLRLVAWGGLTGYDREFARHTYHPRMQWTPSQEDLLKFNAQALLNKANVRVAEVYGGYHVVTSSSIAFQPSTPSEAAYRFDLLLSDDLRFYAVPKDQAPHGVIPMPYVMGADLDPISRNQIANSAGAVQGEFKFQNKDYVFAFLHSLFGQSLTDVISPRLLTNALEDAIAKQFPFFMPPSGFQVGVKLLNLKFKE